MLANEQVIDGRCERCGAEVESRNLEQWFFKITAYADRLLDDLEQVSWPERVVTMQRNWIGRSHGAEVAFRLDELGSDLRVFTTRPDTLFGATFFVLAPEHPRALELADGSEHSQAVADYVRHAAGRSAVERAAAHEKTGVFTGRYVVNPVNGERIPIWVADYVLMEYGTGAIMAVPAHDERDFEFARAHGLAIRPVVAPRGAEPAADVAYSAHSQDEVLVNSGEFTGMAAPEAAQAIIGRLEADGRGTGTIDYRLRDWLLSRQRYWGCPIPIVHCAACGLVPVPDDQLPVVLPDIEDYRAARPLAAGCSRGLGAHAVPGLRRSRDARDGHDGHLRRLVLVLHALRRPAQRHGPVRAARPSTRGCRSTSTSAGSSTRSCTSCTRASSRRRCTTSATSASPSRSRTSSPRG